MAGNPSPTSDVGFVQQGQVDWVAFGNTTVSFTLDILARFQAAGVQELTYAGVMQLTTRFKLPDLCRQRIWDAVQKLGVCSGVSNVLYFGFGHKSFLRFLSESVSGLKCIALCSSLAEMHSADIAARVLAALWKEFEYPENFEPSLQQFKALIKTCSGALATSPFPEVASRLLCPKIGELRDSQRCADPADIAKALHGLFDISTGVRQSVTIIGNSECCFLAAVAHWLFNLNVYVEDVDGQHLFSSSVSNQPLGPTTAQVYVKFVTDSTQQSQVCVSQSTFILNDPSDILVYTTEDRLFHLQRRVPWGKCLSFAFGLAFETLCSCRSELSNLFGSVARISLALAEGEVDVGGFDRQTYGEFAESSYGGGFIDSLETIFPELVRLDMRRDMEFVLSKSVPQATLLLGLSIKSVKQRCGCCRCQYGGDKCHRRCLLTLACALTKLVKVLSSVRFESGHQLNPTTKGLESIYDNFASLRRISLDHFIYASTRCNPSARRSSLYNKGVFEEYTVRDIMDDVATVFTSYGISTGFGGSPSGTCTAASQRGVCIFIEGLVSVTAEAELLRRIHVMPGHIARTDPERRNSAYRQYDKVQDLWYSRNNTSFLRPVEVAFGVQEVGVGGDHALRKEDMTTVVVEPGGVGDLVVFHRITTQKGDIMVQPGALTDLVLASTGLIPCDKFGCQPKVVGLDHLYTVKSGWVLDSSDMSSVYRTACYIWGKERVSEVARVAALSVRCSDITRGSTRNERILVRRRECLACCTRAYARLWRQPRLRDRHTNNTIVHVI